MKQIVGKPLNSKPSAPPDRDLFELPPLPETTALGDDVGDGYYELPIHQMLYTGDIDLDQVCNFCSTECWYPDILHQPSYGNDMQCDDMRCSREYQNML